MLGVRGKFCQLGHGRLTHIRRLNSGDWLIYYAPRTTLKNGEKVQAFVALGQIRAGQPYQVELPGGFAPWRRNVAYAKVRPAKIQPLLDDLSFIKDKRYWGVRFRRSLFEINHHDFELIARAMGIEAK